MYMLSQAELCYIGKEALEPFLVKGWRRHCMPHVHGP